MDHAPKILFLIVDLNSGGAEWQMARLALFLKEEGFDVRTVCFLGRGEVAAWLEAQHVPVECIGYDSARKVWRLGRLVKLLKNFRPDILHTWLFHANFLGRLIGRFSSVPQIVASIRVAEKERPRHLALERLTSRWAKLFLCNSEGVRKHAAAHGLPSSKLAVIPNSLDPGLEKIFEQRSSPPDGVWRLLHLGRRTRQKGLPFLLDALRIVSEKGIRFHLQCVGSAVPAEEDAALRKQIAKLGLDGKVSISPSLPHPKIPALLKEHHLLVFPSLWEGMPNAVMEAFASGLPVVGTDIEGTNELVCDGKTGLLALPANAASFAEKIAESLDNYPRMVSMSVTAHRELLGKHNQDIIHKQYLDSYRKLIRKGGI